jgi:NAD(P)H-hydrate epimerase
MDVLTGARMRSVDEETIRRFYPGIELMERAGRKVSEFIVKRYSEPAFKASIFVGPGNNGGDALVAARYLCEQGFACSLHYLEPVESMTPDASKNHQRLHQRLADYPKLKEINSSRPDWVNIAEKDLIDSYLIVDGLFGTGLTRKLEGRALDVVRLINRSRLPVVSIDVPSGIHSDNGEILGEAVRATHTVTMGFPKLGMLFYPAKACVGELIVADLGFPEEVLEPHSMGIYLLDRAGATRRLPARAPEGHKYRMGTVLVVAGSRAYTGAALLTAEAALRSGSGMVYLAVPESVRPVVQSGLREAVVIALPETQSGSIAVRAMETVEPYMDKADALVVGPGLTPHPETVRFVRLLVERATKPLVLDADALNAFAGVSLSGTRAPIVLTPHSGELSGLLAREIPAGPLERIELTRSTAQESGVTLIHKGAPTLVASAAGEVWVNLHGNSALATAGSGDVLAGLVAGLRAQGGTELDAACVACYLHGRSGELASAEWGVRGVVAGDLLGHLGGPMRELESASGTARPGSY